MYFTDYFSTAWNLEHPFNLDTASVRPCEDATDAAKNAAAMILTTEGLALGSGQNDQVKTMG